MRKNFCLFLIFLSLLVVILLKDIILPNRIKNVSWFRNENGLKDKCIKYVKVERPNLTLTITNPWESIPSYELNIRMSSFEPRWFWNYQRLFLKSYRVFWPPQLNNLTIVLNAEIPEDRILGNKITLMWPFPKVIYLKKPTPEAIGSNEMSERFRMYFDSFYPDLYTSAEYVGFVDTDTLFVTPVTPQNLFDNRKPIVIGVAGNIKYASCTEFMLKQKQLMICMSYFPVTIKVSHLVAMRHYIEKLHTKSFLKVFGEAVLVIGDGKEGCLCQFAVMCNYIYRFHAGEYYFRIQMHPDSTLENTFSESEKTPFPRIAIHSRYILPNQIVDSMSKQSMTMFNDRIKEGICRASGFQWCPEVYCTEFCWSSLQHSLFAFEYYEWFWDKRCFEEQLKHYKNVETLIAQNVQNKLPIFGYYEKQVDVCIVL